MSVAGEGVRGSRGSMFSVSCRGGTPGGAGFGSLKLVKIACGESHPAPPAWKIKYMEFIYLFLMSPTEFFNN